MKDHTSLVAWQEARVTALLVIRASRDHWKPWAGALFGQLQRASLSVQLNIAEGATFGRSPTYTRHPGIAFGSAVETGELIRLATDASILPIPLGKDLLLHSDRTRRLLLGLLKRHRPIR